MSNVSYNVNGCIIEQVYPPVFYPVRSQQPEFQTKIIQTELDKYIIQQKLGDLLKQEIDENDDLMCFFFSNDFIEQGIPTPLSKVKSKGKNVHIGEINAGKSSLINSLIDDDLLSVGTRRTTLSRDQSLDLSLPSKPPSLNAKQSQKNLNVTQDSQPKDATAKNQILKDFFLQLYNETKINDAKKNTSISFGHQAIVPNTKFISAYHITSTGGGECPLITYAKRSITDMKNLQKECDIKHKDFSIKNSNVGDDLTKTTSSTNIGLLDSRIDEGIFNLENLGDFKDYSLYIAFFDQEEE